MRATAGGMAVRRAPVRAKSARRASRLGEVGEVVASMVCSGARRLLSLVRRFAAGASGEVAAVADGQHEDDDDEAGGDE
jgi:LSD1 subclass zinc finger protein